MEQNLQRLTRIVRALNITVLRRFYDCEEWQIGLWLNVFFLTLIFSTTNLMIQTIASVPFSLLIGLPEILLLSYPFAYLGKFSNRGVRRNAKET